MKKIGFLLALFFSVLLLSLNNCTYMRDPEIQPSSTPTPVFTCVTKTITSNSIDFCDDGDTINAMSGYWYHYATGNAAVLSDSLMIQPGFNDCSYSSYIWGNLLDSEITTYVILGTTLTYEKDPVDISAKTGVKFAARLYNTNFSPHTARLRVSSSSVFSSPGGDNNMYGITFTAGWDWAEYQMKFSDFTQESGWGETVSFSSAMQNTESIEWLFRIGYDTGMGMQIDEIEFY